MLSGITFFTKDEIWQKILTDLGAEYNADGVDFDKIKPDGPLSPVKLKSIILCEIEEQNMRIIKSVFKKDVRLSGTGMQIISALYFAGTTGLTGAELCTVLGYGVGIDTHAADTAIYQLRKTYGRDLIRNDNGKYKLGTAGD